MKVRKINPDAAWESRRDAFLKMTPEGRLNWLQIMQSRIRRDSRFSKKLKVHKRLP